MRKGSFFVIVALCLIGLRASAATDPGVEFTGVVVANGVTRLALTEKSTSLTQWVEKGGDFKGVTIVNYEPKQDTIVVRKNGEEFRLPLVSAKSPVTLASPPPGSASGPALSAAPPSANALTAGIPAATVVSPTAPESAPATSYTVRPGDTLATIAANTGVTMEQLQALNPSINGNALKPGDAIRTR